MADSGDILNRIRQMLGGGDRDRSPAPPEPPYDGDAGEVPPGCEDEVDEISCQEAVERVYEYLDGELSGGESEEVRCHVEKCKRCYPYFNWEQVFLRTVQERGNRAEENPELLESVKGMLEEAPGD